MKNNMRQYTILKIICIIACLSYFNCSDINRKLPGPAISHSFPFDLPPHIKQITTFGQRADWSHDGKKILFIEKTFGDVYEVTVETGELRPMTHHYYHEGYVRALYLSNGDILLSGARHFNAEDPVPSRKKNAELWILKKDFQKAPIALDEICYEGPAVSRNNLKIAWSVRGDQPDAVFYMADLRYDEGIPEIINKKKILTKEYHTPLLDIETQNFRPPDGKEIIFSGYGEEYRNCEVMGLIIESGEIRNYSQKADEYDEPEGIFPDGNFTLVECDRHNSKGTGQIDIYKLKLNGSGEAERLTYFADFHGYKSSNPVISDDGRYMAFQVARKNDWAGVGRGIFIFDLNSVNK